MRRNSQVFTTATLVAMAFAVGLRAQKSSAKVEEQVVLSVAPGEQVQYHISPRGHHVAAVVMRGSRQVLVYDGAASEPFDELFPQSIAFSSDGLRHAYVGRRGPDYIYIVDGRAFARFPVATTDRFGGTFDRSYPSNQTTGPAFTSNGRHVYFLVRSNDRAGVNATSTFYFDGKAGPTFATDPPIGPVFSPDGEHYAYMGYDAQHRAGQPPVLIVDGKPTAWSGGAPQFTGDSKHLVTQMGIQGGGTQVQLDGKPWFRVPGGINLWFAPVTDLIIAAGNVPNRNESFLLLNGKRVPGGEGQSIGEAHFSPDGRHWAVVIATETGATFVIVDGKKGLDYEVVKPLTFLPDGKFVYLANVKSRQFIVVGDQESNGYQGIDAMAGHDDWGQGRLARNELPNYVQTAGQRVAFVADKTSGRGYVVIDNKPIPAAHPTHLALSPDGSRFAFAAGVDHKAVVDGIEQPALLPVQQRGRFVFSPDGKHLAYAAYGATAARDGTRPRGLMLDGKFIPLPQSVWRQGGLVFSIHYATFTPDGKHLYWMTGLSMQRAGVYLDGLRVVEIDAQSLPMSHTGDEPPEARWSVGADGVLTLLASDGGVLKRYRITPGPDTSVETLARMTSIQ